MRTNSDRMTIMPCGLYFCAQNLVVALHFKAATAIIFYV